MSGCMRAPRIWIVVIYIYICLAACALRAFGFVSRSRPVLSLFMYRMFLMFCDRLLTLYRVLLSSALSKYSAANHLVQGPCLKSCVHFGLPYKKLNSEQRKVTTVTKRWTMTMWTMSTHMSALS